MPRLLPPLVLSAAAFAVAWALTSPAPSPVSITAGPATGGAAAAAGLDQGKNAPVSGLDHRESQLLALENPSLGEIRRLLENSSLSYADLHALGKRWAEADPAGFWRWLQASGREDLASLTTTAFETWFRKDPKAAILAWKAAAVGAKVNVAHGLMRLFREDAGLRQILLPYLGDFARMGAIIPVEDGQTADFLAQMMKLPDGTGRDLALRATAKEWLREDWKAASAWVDAQAEPLKSQLMAGLAEEVFQAGAASASFDWARQWFTSGNGPSPEVRRYLAASYVQKLAATDPAAALSWARENMSATPLTQAIGRIFGQQEQKDPASARTLLDELPPGGGRDQAAFAVITQPSAESVNWLLSQNITTSSANEWSKLGSQWAFNDPAAYRQYLESAKPDSLPPDLVRAGVENLIRKDGPATLDWLSATGSPKATGQALESWGYNDAPAAAVWIKDHAAGDWSSDSTATVSGQYFRQSPSEAVDWAASLPAGRVRDSAIREVRQALSTSSQIKPAERADLDARLSRP